MHRFFRGVRIFKRILEEVVLADIRIRLIENRILRHIIRRNTLHIFIYFCIEPSLRFRNIVHFQFTFCGLFYWFSVFQTAQYLLSPLNDCSLFSSIKRLMYRVDFLRISSLFIFLLVHSSGNFSLRIRNISLITRTRLRSLAFLRDIVQKTNAQIGKDIIIMTHHFVNWSK